eukprot:Hpha_TRINITY_DN24265_c0_g1::TRINITY_DN24265_c0_g1_i1::g.36054::m.36054
MRLWAAVAFAAGVSGQDCAVWKTDYAKCFTDTGSWTEWGNWQGLPVETGTYAGAENMWIKGLKGSTGREDRGMLRELPVNAADMISVWIFSDSFDAASSFGYGIGLIRIRPGHYNHFPYFKALFVKSNDLWILEHDGTERRSCQNCMPSNQWIHIEINLRMQVTRDYIVCVNGVGRR